MRVITCDSSHAASWNLWVDGSPRATLYHRFEWKAINEACFGHKTAYLAAIDAEGGIEGVLPIVRLKSRLFGNIACSVPFVNFGGPVGNTDEIELRLLEAARPVLDGWHVDYLEVRSRRFLGEHLPAACHKVSMTVALEPDADLVWSRYKAKSGPRQEIRRGYHNGLHARIGGVELLDPLYSVLSESWRDLGTPIFRKAYLREILARFPERTWICAVFASNGQTAAAALCGRHRDTAEGLWLGVRRAFRREMAGYVLYWELIKDACDRGLSAFHLGRSSRDGGGQAFKQKWQADPQQLYWHYVLRGGRQVPALNVANPKFKLAIKAWRMLPIRVTQQIGPYIARSIP